uniref:Translation initiation factor IF-3 n=1 Tax=Calcidiscus leptoporus TaxID=127549 RepID=A0A7S0P751_9EUKA|mmetsp:Transcript_9266/g.21528  ORF Transcript_9266/g.21528 Transcript_9266/m.21528 type:complete len:248 (+) Transcript_9266:104-847(+)
MAFSARTSVRFVLVLLSAPRPLALRTAIAARPLPPLSPLRAHSEGACRRMGSPPLAMAPPRRSRPMQKPPPRDDTPRNEGIQFDMVRVVIDVPGGSDELLGVMSKVDALSAARDRDLDLVLIGAKSDPPVCKIVSYDKFRFVKEKKKKEQQKAVKGQELKELKMSYKIGEHDYDVRKRAAEKFLGQGNKVKFSILFKGREITHANVGQQVMTRMAASLDEIGTVDSPPKVMGRQMIMTVSPKKMPGK